MKQLRNKIIQVAVTPDMYDRVSSRSEMTDISVSTICMSAISQHLNSSGIRVIKADATDYILDCIDRRGVNIFSDWCNVICSKENPNFIITFDIINDIPIFNSIEWFSDYCEDIVFDVEKVCKKIHKKLENENTI